MDFSLTAAATSQLDANFQHEIFEYNWLLVSLASLWNEVMATV